MLWKQHETNCNVVFLILFSNTGIKKNPRLESEAGRCTPWYVACSSVHYNSLVHWNFLAWRTPLLLRAGCPDRPCNTFYDPDDLYQNYKYNFLSKKNQEIVQVKWLYPLSSLLLDAYSVNFRYFGSPGNSSRHSTHNGAQNFEKLMYKVGNAYENILQKQMRASCQNQGWILNLGFDFRFQTQVLPYPKFCEQPKNCLKWQRNFNILPPNAKVGCNSKNNNNSKYYIATNIHYMEPSINNVSNFFGFLTPTSSMSAVFLYYPSAILTNFWPLPPFNCRLRLLSIFNNNFDIWWPAKMSRYTQKENEFLNSTS